VALLGSVTVPAGLADEHDLALRIEIDTGGMSGDDIAPHGASQVKVTLVEAIPWRELTLGDPDWPAYSIDPSPSATGP
jgi:hypothetical protein